MQLYKREILRKRKEKKRIFSSYDISNLWHTARCFTNIRNISYYIRLTFTAVTNYHWFSMEINHLNFRGHYYLSLERSLLSSTHLSTTPSPVCEERGGRNRPFREYRYSRCSPYSGCGIITVFLKREREGGRERKSEVTEGEEKKRSVAHYLERSCLHKNVGSNCLT